MFKSVLKEIIIILLLIVVILLLAGVLFYNYIPSSKVVPEKVQEYALADDIKEELQQELQEIDSDKIVKTYQVDARDIKNYEKENKYNKGKINPFAPVSSGVNGNTSSGENQNTIGNNTTPDNTFYNNTGK